MRQECGPLPAIHAVKILRWQWEPFFPVTVYGNEASEPERCTNGSTSGLRDFALMCSTIIPSQSHVLILTRVPGCLGLDGALEPLSAIKRLGTERPHDSELRHSGVKTRHGRLVLKEYNLLFVSREVGNTIPT